MSSSGTLEPADSSRFVIVDVSRIDDRPRSDGRPTRRKRRLCAYIMLLANPAQIPHHSPSQVTYWLTQNIKPRDVAGRAKARPYGFRRD